jgi:hypothetical protein
LFGLFTYGNCLELFWVSLHFVNGKPLDEQRFYYLSQAYLDQPEERGDNLDYCTFQLYFLKLNNHIGDVMVSIKNKIKT